MFYLLNDKVKLLLSAPHFKNFFFFLGGGLEKDNNKFDDELSAGKPLPYDHTNRFTASPNSFDKKSIVCKYSHFCDVYS